MFKLNTILGSAPVSDEVMMFCQAAFGSPIPEGYGQTECTCALTFRHPFDPVLGLLLLLPDFSSF